MTQEDADRPAGHHGAWTLGSALFTMLLSVVAFLLPELERLPRGGLVGWLLLLAGLAELAFGWKRALDMAGKTAIGSGLITAMAGLLFVLNPLADYYPVANIVMIWLFVRGAWVLAMAMRVRSERLGLWLAISAAADLLLGALLLGGLPIAAFVIALFGPTVEVVARFAMILAASFLANGLSQVGIALLQSKAEPQG
jgi:uncharacterized membrane protein HdeD (DUF308 family)